MYDNSFFTWYNKYLKEPSVRVSHDRVFKLLRGFNTDFDDVVDLGCGVCEYLRYAQPEGYLGIDTTDNGASATCASKYNAEFDIADYRTQLVLGYKPAFISLFSIENTGSVEDNYKLYNYLLLKTPHIRCGCSAGFYYSDKKDCREVKEAGNIVSLQTLESLEEAPIIPGINETRIIVKTPSTLFGKNVVEVWKLFTVN